MGSFTRVQGWLWTDSPPWYLVLGLPVVGAAIVLAARTFLPGDGGHPPLEGLSPEPMPLSHAPGIVLAGMGTLCFGAVLGPRSTRDRARVDRRVAVTSFARVGARESRVLGTAGSFSAISALFGGPIVAGVMMMEAGVGLDTGLTPALLPGFVAASLGYVVLVGFGDWGGLDAPGLAVRDLELYDGTRILDLVVALAVGVATALTIAYIRRSTISLAGGGERRLGMPAFLLVGGVAVGLLALLADGLGGDSQDVLFSGQASIPALVAENSTGVAVLLVVAKAIAYAVSRG